MKTIIAGSRTITSYEVVLQAIIESNIEITEVVSGTARGVDRLGERFASEAGIPCKQFPADWEKYNKAAGHIRNGQMADYADALIACYDGESKGTLNMIQQATKRGLRVYVYRI